MAELDNLIGSHLSLISQADVRYDGILFSINPQESSIVLRDVKCLGTETRVSEDAKKVAPTSTTQPFVTFSGSDIKDLYVHEPAAATPAPAPAPAPATANVPPPAPPARAPRNQSADSGHRGPPAAGPRDGGPTNRNAPRDSRPQQQQQQQQHRQPAHQQHRQPRPAHHAAPAPAPASAASAASTTTTPASTAAPVSSTAGTGEHLLRMRVRTDGGAAGGSAAPAAGGEFDFEAGLQSFNKDQVLASVAEADTTQSKSAPKYVKDDFFDSLSCDVLDREQGRAVRLRPQEERTLNQDTFGAIAVQSNYRYGGGGYRRGRGGGRGGGGGYRGGGRGRGSA